MHTLDLYRKVIARYNNRENFRNLVVEGSLSFNRSTYFNENDLFEQEHRPAVVCIHCTHPISFYLKVTDYTLTSLTSKQNAVLLKTNPKVQ